jgi:hypothetical protein
MIIVVLIVMTARRYDTSYFPNPDDYDVSYYDIFDCDDPQKKCKMAPCPSGMK